MQTTGSTCEFRVNPVNFTFCARATRSPGDRGALEMDLMEVEPDRLLEPELRFEDFSAVATVRARPGRLSAISVP